MRSPIIRSKMTKTRPLMVDPLICRYVPETKWFTAGNLRRMLRRYVTLYIKPDKGRKGNGVIRVRKRSNSRNEISYGRTIVTCDTQDLVSELNKIRRPSTKYVIQRGIDLATCDNRPFDIRVVLVKPREKWHLSWISAKVAPNQNSVVTNVAKGATDVSLNKTLGGIDQRLDTKTTLRELTNVSYQIAQVLGTKLGLRIVGLDMAIDKRGKVWFIEANTRPDFSGLQRLDRRQYARHRTLKRLMERTPSSRKVRGPAS